MNTLVLTAVPENLPQALRFIDSQLETAGCGSRVQMQIEVAVEEIFVNIASYAYDPGTGQVELQAALADDPLSVSISFADRGKPFNSLEKPDPNLKAPIRERKKGGLGVYMVKNSMDRMTYEYKDGQNILTITKNIR